MEKRGIHYFHFFKPLCPPHHSGLKNESSVFQAFPRLKLGFFHVFRSKNNFKHSHFLRFFALRGENSKLNFKNNFYLIKLIFHDPISTKWLKGFQKYFAYILPMVQGCTQTVLVSILKKSIFFQNFSML